MSPRCSVSEGGPPLPDADAPAAARTTRAALPAQPARSLREVRTREQRRVEVGQRLDGSCVRTVQARGRAANVHGKRGGRKEEAAAQSCV